MSLPVERAVLASCPVKPNAASRSDLPASAPLGTVAVEVERDGALAPWPCRRRQRALGLVRHQRQVGQRRVEAEIGRAGGIGAVGGNLHLSLAMRKPSAPARSSRATRPLSLTVPPAPHRAPARRAQVLRRAVERQVEAAGQRADRAGCASAPAPPSRSRPATPENGAMRAGLDRDLAVEHEAVELPASRHVSALPTSAQLASCTGLPAFHSPAMPRPTLSPSAAWTSARWR